MGNTPIHPDRDTVDTLTHFHTLSYSHPLTPTLSHPLTPTLSHGERKRGRSRVREREKMRGKRKEESLQIEQGRKRYPGAVSMCVCCVMSKKRQKIVP